MVIRKVFKDGYLYATEYITSTNGLVRLKTELAYPRSIKMSTKTKEV